MKVIGMDDGCWRLFPLVLKKKLFFEMWIEMNQALGPSTVRSSFSFLQTNLIEGRLAKPASDYWLHLLETIALLMYQTL